MFPALIEKLMRREDLTSDEAAAAMAEVMEGRAAEAQIAGTARRPRDERRAAGRDRRPGADDAGARRAALAAGTSDVFDTCGTGGDRSGTFNISSCAALVVAACGVRVAKHGNRSVSSQCGSADVFEALGVRVTAPPAVVERCLDRGGHRVLLRADVPSVDAARRADAQGARRADRVQPARAADESGRRHASAGRRAAAGVHRAAGAALLLLGSKRAWVVHGADGIDEISTTGYTKISECRDGAVNTFYLHPADVGLAEGAAGGASRRNAARRTRGSSGRFSRASAAPARDVVLLNAGAALFIAGKAASIEDGMARAAGAIDRGDAARTLERMVALSTAEESTAGAGA